jgi:O-antigen ligase
MGESLRTRLGPAAVVGVLACLAGIAVAALPEILGVLLVMSALGLLGLVAARAVMRPEPGVSWTGDADAPEDPHLRLPRLFYYLGAATIGLLTIRPAAGFTASDWLFFVSFGLCCLAMLAGRFRHDYLVPRVITLGVVLFAFGGLVSSTNALDPNASVAVVARLLYLTLIWFWLGTIVLENRRHLQIAVVAWVSSAAISSAGAIVQLAIGGEFLGGGYAWGRASGLTPQYNNLAGLAATAFVPALAIAIDSRPKSVRLLGLASVGLVITGLLLSGSVGGLTAASVSLVLWLALRGVTQKVVLFLAVLVAAGFIAMGSVSSSPDPVQRVLRVTSPQAQAGSEGSIFTRLDGYKLAWAHIRDHPLVGVGLDDASNVEALEGHFAHNILLNPWFSAGILGLVGIVLMIGGALNTGRLVIRRSRGEVRGFTAALFSSLVAFILFAMGEPILFVRYGWFAVALLVAARAQQVRAATVRERVSRSPRPRVGVGDPLPGLR